MKKLLFVSLFFIANVNSDIDLGEDFAPGDLVTADAFNTKFNALNGVVGEIFDADLLGNWECTAYKEISDQDEDFETANGGNGQVGSGYFASNTGTLSLFESDSDSSLNSPKSWSITRDVIGGSAGISGTYSLLANRLFLFSEVEDSSVEVDGTIYPLVKAVYILDMLSASKISLIRQDHIYPILNWKNPNKNIICEVISDSE